ncbi:MAG: HlyD family efflux transporter periplasmic adaptor subunit [Alphaproteobacteria bacterium]|nr:HlyD family efflux transporter periplasmic adaptor subunit [Alphaproteobacteria bacterium]MBV9372014.1 HlyD family efflux transporter periplasmic adaptor subunit [Alphaproteobacteria bacterium]MBV9901712.1 HlyD family efflux transporter periplasmic adaptor subunit [Alphaproteobacteria bacterium]
MATRLFREEAIEAGRDRLTGTVVAAVPPGSRLYTAVLAAIAAALVALLCLGQYATRVTVKGVVANGGGLSRVHPPAAAEVQEVLVGEGARVARGTPLVAVSLTQGRDAGGEGVASRLAELDRQDRELARQLDLASSLGSADTSALVQQKSGLAESIASLDRQRGFISGQIALAEADTRRAVRLAKEGAGTQRQVEESRATLLSQRLELEKLGERITGQRESLRQLDAQIASRRIGADQSQSQLAAQRAQLAEQRAALLRQDRLTLTAPVAGVIGDVAARPGQHVEPDSSLVTVVPGTSAIEVQLYAPSRAVGFVRPGQEVRLMFDAFPYQKYGAGRGRVTWVSDVPTDPATLDPGLGIGEPVFRVRVALEGGLREEAARNPLRPGMTLSANLLLEKRRLWEVFLDPVLRALKG